MKKKRFDIFLKNKVRGVIGSRHVFLQRQTRAPEFAGNKGTGDSDIWVHGNRKFRFVRTNPP